MGSNPVDSLPQCNIVVHNDFTDADNINEKTCPVCEWPLKLYQIHYDEKFLMCGNIQCSYPFGVTDYHIYKIVCDEEFVRNDIPSSMMSASTSGSTISNSDWSDLEHNTDHFNSSITPPPSLENPAELQKIQDIKKTVKKEELLKRNVEKIKQLNKQLCQFEDTDSISNDKWIKEIAKMQERSGVQVLKEHEMEKFKQLTQVDFGELKLDINSTGCGISLKVDVAKEDIDKDKDNQNSRRVEIKIKDIVKMEE